MTFEQTNDFYVPGAISETEERFQGIERQIQLVVQNQIILMDMLTLLKNEISGENK